MLCIAHHNSTHAATPFPPQCRPLNFSGRALWRKSSILKWEYAAFRTKGLCPVCTSGCFSTPRGRFRCRVCCHNASYQRLFFTLSHFSIDHIFLISLTTTDPAHFRGVATHDGWATAQLLEALLEQVNDATYYGEVSRSAGVTLHASACAL